MSDTWSDIQEHKRRQESLRERLQRRRKERQGLSDQISEGTSTPPPEVVSVAVDDGTSSPVRTQSETVKVDPQLEKKLLLYLCDPGIVLPVDSISLTQDLTSKSSVSHAPQEAIESLLEKFAIQDFICTKSSNTKDGKAFIILTEKNKSKLEAVVQEMKDADTKSSATTAKVSRKRKREGEPGNTDNNRKVAVTDKPKTEAIDDIESLLSMPTTKEIENKKVGDEVMDLLNAPSYKEQSTVEKFKSQGGAFVHEFCEHGTRDECRRNNPIGPPCKKVHFRKIIQKHTDESLGDCSFLNTCFHMDTCKYVHYEVDYSDVEKKKGEDRKSDDKKNREEDKDIRLYPPQWIQCDLRSLDMSVLGKFAVVMADPPWDIHMELPYGTMSDDEMRKLDVPSTQDDGYIFLWVTGRAMELGRECLKLWGYTQCDELIWVKTNQLQRLIRTGRTGHWLNHGKEHCLVGVKGNPKGYNRGLDCDVLVAEVRSTSHKPDEIYGVIERLAPGSRKLELFGRQHNVQPNWITLGNQLDGVRLLEPDVVERFRKRYPDGNALTSSASS